MARKVFFSFHYDRDVRRIVQVRNSWVVRSKGEAQPFYDKAAFEEAKKRAGGIEKWIEEQLKGTSVTVVLFGAETYEREWRCADRGSRPRRFRPCRMRRLRA